jgi:hypothetical protein
MGFVKFKTNTEGLRPNTPRVVEVDYQTIPFAEIKYEALSWTTMTSGFTAGNWIPYKINATSGNMDIYLPPAAGTAICIFIRIDTTSNIVRLRSPNSTDKIPDADGTIPVGLTGWDFKNILTNRVFYVSQKDATTYNLTLLNRTVYPYDRNNNNNPSFI